MIYESASEHGIDKSWVVLTNYKMFPPKPRGKLQIQYLIRFRALDCFNQIIKRRPKMSKRWISSFSRHFALKSVFAPSPPSPLCRLLHVLYSASLAGCRIAFKDFWHFFDISLHFLSHYVSIMHWFKVGQGRLQVGLGGSRKNFLKEWKVQKL